MKVKLFLLALLWFFQSSSAQLDVAVFFFFFPILLARKARNGRLFCFAPHRLHVAEDATLALSRSIRASEGRRRSGSGSECRWHRLCHRRRRTG